MIGDLLGSVAAILAALVILFTGWMPIDPILSLVVALLIVSSAWYVIRESVHVLLEGAPDGIDIPVLEREIAAAVPGVVNVHHVHVWSLSQEQPLITLHALLDEVGDDQRVLSQIQRLLKDNYGLGHSTIQLEREHCGD